MDVPPAAASRAFGRRRIGALAAGGALACLLASAPLAGAELLVGPQRALRLPSQAAAAARDGDTITIDAGEYRGDVCTWRAAGLTIRSAGGFAHLKAEGKAAGGKAIWVIAGAGTTVEGIAFSGAAVPDRNGAGIRLEGAGLTVRGCRFQGNENGILAGDNPDSDVLIERSEFDGNGSGDGYSHNLYINHVRSLTFRENASHHARVGHNLKSRALTSRILCNRFADDGDGTASYGVDLPNGGLAFIIGNLVQKGPQAQNGTLVSYGEEARGANPVQRCYIIGNTLVNDRGAGTFIALAPATALARIENNLLLGAGTAIAGPATTDLRNLRAGDAAVADRARRDYRPAAGSPAIDAGADPGSADGCALLADRQYRHPLGGEPRPLLGGAPDAGAWEFNPQAAGR